MLLLYNFMGYKFKFGILGETDFMAFFDLLRVEYNMELSPQKSLLIIIALLLVIIIISINAIKTRKKLNSVNLQLLTLAKQVSEHNDREVISDQTISLLEMISVRYFKILKEVPLLKLKVPERILKDTDEMLIRINQIIYDGDLFNWGIFYEAANIMHKGYFEKVKDKFPELDHKDFIICCMTYLNIHNNEIAEFLKVSMSTITNRKTDIRKKLQMGLEQNIPKFIDKHLNDKKKQLD